MSRGALEQLGSYLREGVIETHAHRGDETALIQPSMVRAACLWLKEEQGFDMLSDLTAVDYLGQRGAEGRFEVVYHIYSVSKRRRLRLKVAVDAGEAEVDTVSDIWKNANWLEREVWDLYGIKFRKHPDLRRILLYEQFDGHPLRKDYPKDRRWPLSRRPPDELKAIVGDRDKSGRRLA